MTVYIYFWGHTSVPGRITRSCLSQWYPAPFTENGVTFPTAEHYMMYQKAKLFGDKGAMKAILEADTPKKAKELGRHVKHFRPDVWEKHCREIVAQGNYLKFSQNKELGHYLNRTGKAILVEASPYDKIWGIGISREDAEKGVDWQGTNWLGEALMRVRDWLKPWHPEGTVK